MEQRCGPFVFFSNFDSGNLARVERNESYSVNANVVTVDSDGEKDDSTASPPEVKADHAFNVWVSPDCAGTQYQNGNRSWFHFGMRGNLSSHTVRVTVMNMNRQSKLYAQGYNVIAKFLPNRPQWERLRIKTSYKVNEASFMLTFICTFPHFCDTAYFAFCYPWSYEESQQQLAQLDSQFAHCLNLQRSDTICNDSIYFYRETICHTLQGRKVDLVTITDYSNMLPDSEPRFDPKLFPDRKERCKAFRNKRVFVLTSRVHPGETPGSFVFNGFLNFILRPNDPRAKKLRQLYVFKLIPMLNPDGVYCGHYRTDTRGVNLNRVYLDPNFELYPSIYAAKALIVFHHINNRVKPSSVELAQPPANGSNADPDIKPQTPVVELTMTIANPNRTPSEIHKVSERLLESRVFNEEFLRQERSFSDLRKSSSAPLVRHSSQAAVMEQELRRSGLTTSNLPVALNDEERRAFAAAKRDGRVHFELGNEGSDEDDIDFTPPVGPGEVIKYAPHLCDKSLLDIPHSMSGIAFYVDLHGHASKRGCFMYGNHLEDETQQVDNVAYAKLISLNSQHFDFEACNFTEKNMYAKDRHDNSSKEGSGRVAIFKAIGIVHSYTLECNYNMGRVTNVLSNAVGPGCGRCTPPPPPSYMATRFGPAHFEEVGRGVAIAALDMVQENPCSRLPSTEFGCLSRLKEWIRYRVLAGRAEARIYRSSLSSNSQALFTGPKNGGASNFQATTKHRSMSMPGAPTAKANGKTPPKAANNRVSNTQKQANSPPKQPLSPTKRTLSFSTKTTSPYFSKPTIGGATNNGNIINQNTPGDDVTLTQPMVNNSNEPASKWPSIAVDGDSKKPSSPIIQSLPAKSQQLLSVNKVEPSLAINPTTLPWAVVVSNGTSGISNGSQHSPPLKSETAILKPVVSLPSARQSEGHLDRKTNNKTPGTDDLRRINRRPQSRGYSFFSNSHIYPSSPALLSANGSGVVSKSYAPSSAPFQRQMSANGSADRVQQQHQISAQTSSATLFSKPSDEANADFFEQQDSTDVITEMFESSALELALPDGSSVLMVDEAFESSNAIFPPIQLSPRNQFSSVSSVEQPLQRPVCAVNLILPFSEPISVDNNNNGNNSLPSNHRNMSLLRRRNFYATQRASLVSHARSNHRQLRITHQSPSQRKK